MYDELIKLLRCQRFGDCPHCPMWYTEEVEPNLWRERCAAIDAADAIEELQADKAELNGTVTNLLEQIKDLGKPRWIPVTERLPKDGVFVLVCNDDGHIMIAKHESETYEWYYKYTNYDFDIWDNEEQGPVCYWMPLPEPPKEE